MLALVKGRELRITDRIQSFEGNVNTPCPTITFISTLRADLYSFSKFLP